jgi:hypothetical protein
MFVSSVDVKALIAFIILELLATYLVDSRFWNLLRYYSFLDGWKEGFTGLTDIKEVVCFRLEDLDHQIFPR